MCATTSCTFSTSNGNRIIKKWPEHVVLWTFLLKTCFAPERRALFSTYVQKRSGPEVFCTFCLSNVLRATMAYTFSTSQLPKVLRQWQLLTLFTSKCASRHSSVRFFNISTSKNALRMVCLLRHFLFPNVLHTATACTFSTSQLPTVFREWCVCFDTFYFQMCLAPERCALFHLSSGQLALHPPL